MPIGRCEGTPRNLGLPLFLFAFKVVSHPLPLNNI